jgi:hypothetical protein
MIDSQREGSEGNAFTGTPHPAGIAVKLFNPFYRNISSLSFLFSARQDCLNFLR